MTLYGGPEALVVTVDEEQFKEGLREALKNRKRCGCWCKTFWCIKKDTSFNPWFHEIVMWPLRLAMVALVLYVLGFNLICTPDE